MDLFPALGLFVISVAILLAGAKFFIDGLAVLAGAAGISPLVIGMTVVAFGTSTPELVVNTLAAYRGETQLAFGNIAGSCIVNTGFVLAVTAIVRPLRVEPSLITREIPMLIVAVLAFLILAWDGTVVRTDGLVLLLLFGIFLYYTAIYSMANKLLAGPPHEDAFLEEIAEKSASRKPMVKDYFFVAGGLAAVSFGADGAVSGATAMARGFGLSEAVIGLTVVSMGTTLPELVTCVMAARKGNSDIALGNVVGSNLFNIMAIGGLVAVVAPVGLPPGGMLDLLVMALLTIVLLPIAIRSGRTITRGEGAFLLALYVAYLVYRLTQPAAT
ncbi:MAG: calcium/sodium antiporter [Acidobacteria bacterium]|nr:calcium/sodium antiporter [Acidobacteriota bacterium]